MSRVHDMGGRFGDGPVVPEPDGVLFREDWHKRALALTLAGGALGAWNIDISRHAREALPAGDYNRFSYYEKWVAALTNLLVENEMISRDELLNAEMATAAGTQATKCLMVDQVAGVLAKGAPANRPALAPPAFAVGDRVVARARAAHASIPGGHTRQPRYTERAEGYVVRVHGTHVLPDSSAHELGETPEPLYAVSFPASELWTHPEHPGDEVVVDMWESYLEPVS